MKNVKLTYLAHSGFVAETENYIFVFDYFEDKAGVVEEYVRYSNKKIWFFVTHCHADHFNPEIANFSDRASRYVVHDDVKLKKIKPEQLTSMNVYDTFIDDGVRVTMFGSTDEGGSFFVEADTVKLFHAGDLNWWYWLDESEQWNQNRKTMYAQELKKMEGLTVDVAFFPVDSRMEEKREWGVMEFLNHVTVKNCLVPMHYFGTPWEPSLIFQAKHEELPLWIPKQPGNNILIHLL